MKTALSKTVATRYVVFDYNEHDLWTSFMFSVCFVYNLDCVKQESFAFVCGGGGIAVLAPSQPGIILKCSLGIETAL